MFTEKEIYLLATILNAGSNKDSAKILNMDIKTYKEEINKLYAKMGVHNRLQAVIKILHNNNLQ